MIDPTDDKIKLLHTAVSQKYDVGTLEEFSQKLQDPTKRKTFYDEVGKEYELGEYSDFENKVKKKDSTAFVLDGTIDVSKPAEQLSVSSPSLSPEQQILTGQIPEPQSSGITIPPAPKPLTFEEIGLNYDKKRMAEEKAKASMGDTYYEMYGKPEPQGVIQDFAKDLEQVAPAFNKGVIQAFTSIPKAVGILAQGIEKLTGWRDKPIEEYPLYEFGKWIEDKALELGLTATDPKHSNFFNADLPNAFGSMLGMMATGGASVEGTAAKGLEVAPSAMSAIKEATPLMTTGAAQNSVPEFDAAKAAGMSDEQAFKVFLNNIPGGLTEAAPIIDAFGRLNKLTGNSILNVLKVGTANGLEEATQEGVQQWATNLVAQGTYDPKRAQWEGMVQSLGAAFIVGFVLPGVMTAMAKQPKSISDQVLSDIHKALKDNEGSGKGIVGETIQKGVSANEKPTEQSTEVFGQKVPEVKQEESVPVQTAQEEQKTENLNQQNNEITNNPTEATAGQRPEVSKSEEQVEPRTESEQPGSSSSSNREEKVRENKILETEPSSEVEFVPKDEWDKNLIKAREYANHLNIDTKEKSLEQLVNEIHHAISQQSSAGLGTYTGRNESVGRTSESSRVGPSEQGNKTSKKGEEKSPPVADNTTGEVEKYFIDLTKKRDNGETYHIKKEVEGEPLKKYKSLNLFLHKDSNREGYAISEKDSGTKVVAGETKKEAREKLEQLINNYGGIDSFKKVMNEKIEIHNEKRANENTQMPVEGSEVHDTESNKEVEADAIKEANDIAKEHDFDSATHLLNSVKKRTGKEYAAVQEIPKKVIDQVKEERNSKLKKGDTVDFLVLNGQSKTGTIEGFNEEKGKYKIKAVNGTVWDVASDNINVYEGEQASTKKFYEPPVGAPRKSKGKVQRISVSPVYGADPKMLKQIIIDLSKSIASKIYYAKRVAGRRRALGTYSPANAAIHIKFQGDLDTTAHELGHSIDDVFDLLGKSNPVMDKELNELSKFGSKPKKGDPNSKEYKLGEGLAEYIRAWLVNPIETKTKYPETTKVFESTVPKGTMDKIRSFGDDIRKYAGLSGHNKIMSNVQFEPEKNNSWFTRFIKNKSKENFELTWMDRLGQQWTNTLIPFEKAVKFLIDKQGTTEVQPSQDPIILARLLAGENSKIQDIIENGFIDTENPIDSSNPKDVKLNRLIDPLSGEAMNFEWLITPLDNSTEQSIKEEQKKVISYMVAKRTLEMSTKLGREDFLTGIGAGIFQDVTVAKERLVEHDNENKETKDRIEEAARRYQAYANAGLEVAVANGRLSKESLKIIKDANMEYVALNRIAEVSPDEEVVSFNKSGNNAIGTTSEIIKKQKGSTKTIQNPYQSLIENTSKVIRESDRNNVLLAFKELAVSARKMHEGEPKYLGSVATQVGATGDNTITIFDNGQKEYWKFDGDVYESLKNINDNIKLPGWATAVARLTRWGVIHYPTFVIKNRIRDFGDRLIISKEAQKGFDINFKKGRKKATLDAYNQAGGGQSGYYLMNEEFYYHQMDEATHELAKDKNVIITIPSKISDFYNKMLTSGETATRLEEYRSAFKQAKAKGLDDYNAMIFAAFKARDLLDFAVAGQYMKQINKIVPFSNAAVQGLRKQFNSAKSDPVGFSIRWALYSAVPSLFIRMLVHLLDKDKEYEQLSPWRRDLFYNIPITDNLWLAIPKPFILGVLGAGTERLMSIMVYNKKDAMAGYAGSVARSLTPIDESAFVGPAKALIEVEANYDFFRAQHIIPTEEEGLYLKLRNTGSASRLGKVLSSQIKIDPRFIDHIIKSNLGNIGDGLLRASDIGRDDSRHPIDFTATGLFRNDPVYDSKSVQHLMNEVKRLGVKSNDSFLKLFNLTLSDYFDQKDPKLKSEAGETVRQTAEFITKVWEGISLEEMTLMKHDIKQSVRK